MITSSSAAKGLGRTRRLFTACCLALGLLVSLAACDGSRASDEDAEAREYDELKVRLDSIVAENEEYIEELSERLAEQQEQAVNRLAEVLSEAYEDSPGTPRRETGQAVTRTSLKDAPLGGGSLGPLGGGPRASGSVFSEQVPIKGASKDSGFEYLRGPAARRRVRVMNGVKAAVAQLGGKIDTEDSNDLIYFMPFPDLPWTATYQNGSLILSQKVTGVPDDSGILTDIRHFANSSLHSSSVQLTSSLQPNGRKTWHLEVSRTLPWEELDTNDGIENHIDELWGEHIGLLGALEQRHNDLWTHLKPVVKTRLASAPPAAVGGRGPTEAEMLQAMRNHWAAHAGRGMFTVAGVEKIASERLSANRYRVVYVPRLAPVSDDLVGALIAISPSSEAIATFTYADGAWHFSGAE